MSDITIVKERGSGGIGSYARIIPHNAESGAVLKELILESVGHYTVPSDLAEEMAETLREKGLDVDVK